MVRRESKYRQRSISLEGAKDRRGRWLTSVLQDCSNVATEVERKLLSEELKRAMDLLPVRQRQVIEKTVIGGCHLNEAAQDIGVTPQAVCGLRKRGLGLLRVILEKSGFSCRDS